MSHVSTTAHYGLPIYGDVDIINPLTDFNDCNTAIDNKLYEVAQGTAGVVTDITNVKNVLGSETLDTASQTVTGAINELKASEDAIDTKVVASETDIATLQAQMSTATTNISNLGTSVAGLQTEMTGKASATALQTLTNKVGTGNLDTQAQNCVDAINEVLSKIPAGGAVKAEDVTYDNTTSGLTATDAQGAIDEVATDIEGAIDDIGALKPTRTPDITITADGVKNLKQLFTEIADAVDMTKLTPFSVIDLRYNDSPYAFGCNLNALSNGNGLRWSYCGNTLNGTTTEVDIYTCIAQKSTSGGSSLGVIAQIKNNTTSTTDQSNQIPTSGSNFRIYY